jgi:RNA polymerase sigma factor (TIGR02999 family)
MNDEAPADLATHAAELASMPPDALARCYKEMRLMARRILARNSLGYVLQPTELANESAIRLIRSNFSSARNEAHLLAIAAKTMRQILVDESRKANAAKRDVGALMTAWPENSDAAPISLSDIDAALSELAAISPQRADIVELRFMLGMTIEETAIASGISERTVKRQWQAARAWLLARLRENAVD